MMQRDSSGAPSVWDKKRQALLAASHQEDREELLAAGIAAMRRCGSKLRVGRVIDMFRAWEEPIALRGRIRNDDTLEVEMRSARIKNEWERQPK